jgi:tetratricopeptide (TPR) repeat protein
VDHKRIFPAALASSFLSAAIFVVSALGQIPGQLAQDFPAGNAPSPEMVAQYEKDAAASPNDLRLVRKLGKAYFFQFFDEGLKEAVPKSIVTLERALTIQKDDPETLAYLGSLHVLRAVRLEKKDATKQKASFDKGFEMVKLAEKLDPRNGAVLSVASATYLWLPDSYNMAPHVVGMLEGMIKGMGPYFKKFHHHGQQRILMTLGEAYVRTGNREKGKALFDEALAINTTSREAALLRAELKKLGN